MTAREREVRKLVATVKVNWMIERSPATSEVAAIEYATRLVANILLDRIDKITRDYNRAIRRTAKGRKS